MYMKLELLFTGNVDSQIGLLAEVGIQGYQAKTVSEANGVGAATTKEILIYLELQ